MIRTTEEETLRIQFQIENTKIIKEGIIQNLAQNALHKVITTVNIFDIPENYPDYLLQETFASMQKMSQYSIERIKYKTPQVYQNKEKKFTYDCKIDDDKIVFVIIREI